jgi:protein-S-isoprenylcysteine O-methyltransferase Ste14
MYVALGAGVGGVAFVARSGLPLVFAALVWTLFHHRVDTYEEPVLGRGFGARFDEYAARVPPWIPRRPVVG